MSNMNGYCPFCDRVTIMISLDEGEFDGCWICGFCNHILIRTEPDHRFIKTNH